MKLVLIPSIRSTQRLEKPTFKSAIKWLANSAKLNLTRIASRRFWAHRGKRTSIVDPRRWHALSSAVFIGRAYLKRTIGDPDGTAITGLGIDVEIPHISWPLIS